ncbi:DNA polymerase [Acidithiobacillus ferrooxidans]|uniref:DNA-directed DNA polymerase n=1 Tax=Acidithiobacillus ferrooxidans TaxID=920 RepID=A0A2W1K6I0_ACIFR|nr:DNA polymerase [Acidithiobacillus ferrooxidans]MCR1344033.1 DNA polymerase [Acidithiobacillus ferrooxidans]PZD82409.1 hypothetical protein DN052_05170 [Acidithiobacillus ferrooxidans]QLK41317.1 hypothetical protein FE661_03395 [Acidithiobacillus ferrooxidans]QZT53259.1 hypothetical protein K7B00_03395 [Acidithiobacillus ferrooxidans]BDB13355.1 hypothetical protein ANFP_06750 [Acidithiobacillus ferrooxidans]
MFFDDDEIRIDTPALASEPEQRVMVAVSTPPKTPCVQEPVLPPLELTPSKGATPPVEQLFAGPEDVCQAVEVLFRDDVEEVVLDFETTALTPWSSPKDPGTTTRIGTRTISQMRKDGVTFNTTPRARVLSVYVPAANYKAAFDLDLLSTEDKVSLADALTGKTWVGHNLGFDYQWMLTLSPHCRPDRIVDTMLLTTACRPDAEICMQGAVVKHHTGGRGTSHPRKHIADLQQYLQERSASTGRGDKDDGAMPLKALSLWLLDEKMDKQYQMPHNWMPDQLSHEHYAYCMGDVEAPGTIARRLLNLPDDSPLQDLLDGIDVHPGGKAYRIFEGALHTLVRMQRKGIPWSSEAAADLDAALGEEAEAAAEDLVKVAPALETPIAVPQKPTKKNPNPDPKMVYPIKDLLNPTKGLSSQVKAAIADAIFIETHKPVPLSDTGGPTLDAKTLAFEFPGSKVVAALNTLQGKSKARSMIAKYAASAGDGRLHPITGINTVTGRTSAQEPALQQVPRDPRFRAIFAAGEGHQILATDFSSIELRIAAALGVRAWRELQAIVGWASGDRGPTAKKASMAYQSVSWLFKNEPDLLPFLQATDPATVVPEWLLDVPQPSGRDASVEEWGRSIAADLARWVYKIRMASGGDEARLSFRAAYVGGLDPHLLTALAMQAQGGHFDLRGKSPLAFLQGLSGDEAKTLKHGMKDARQGAKAVNFGSLYGQQPLGLHRYGVTGYGLTWSVEEAAAAHRAWFDLYPEIGLWHWLLRYAHKVKASILNPYNASEMRTVEEGGKVFRWYTLSGRTTISPKVTGAANFQDQGTGAEIALDALASLPGNVAAMLVNFVHDELVLEVPAMQVEEVQAIVERTMIASANKYLLPFGIPTEVESSVGDCWIH